MAEKHTYEYVKSYIENLGYELISKEYKNNSVKLILKDKNGYYYVSRFNDLRKFKPCRHGLSNPYTLQNIQLWLSINYNGCILLSDKFTGSNDKLLVKDTSGYYYTPNLSGLLRLNKLQIVDSNIYAIQNIKLWLKLNNKLFELISDTYISATDNLKLKCLKNNCGEIFQMSWNMISSGHCCSYCCVAPKKVGLSNCLATRNPELAKEWNTIKNGKLTPYKVTPNYSKKVWWKCKECNHEWPAKINGRNYGTGCPECKKSKGEKECKRVLLTKGLIGIAQEDYNKLSYKNNYTYFISQKEFDGLIGLGGKLLSYDFYIPRHNLLIEVQGEQHEKPVDFDGKGKKHAEKQFKKQLEHDRRKREYAKKHNIRLLEIWYWDFDRIESILQKELNVIFIA